jgi:hypothetical protein
MAMHSPTAKAFLEDPEALGVGIGASLCLPIDGNGGGTQEWGMRAIVILVLSSALLVGCKHARPSDAKAPPGQAAAQKPADKKATRETKKTAPTATAITEPIGKVASINTNLRFVVIDFGLNPAPPADQMLSVYRQGQKVGEVKLSGPPRNNIIAADLIQGEANVGDEVRR